MNADKHQHLSEQELLERFYSDQNKEWLGILLQRYTLLLLGVCMKYLKNEELARDAVQQTFLKVITELGKYKVEYFKSWLYMVAKNHCLMQLRVRNHTTREFNEELQIPAAQDNLSELLEKEFLLDSMHEGLQNLHPEQQQCLTLFYLEKKSYQQISQQTGFSHLQVKSFIQNGKRNLRLQIERKQLLPDKKP